MFAGIVSLREGRASLQEQILDLENAGKWADALNCYDKALQAKPDDINCRLGLLNSFRNLGHVETMLSLVKGGLATLPKGTEPTTLNSTNNSTTPQQLLNSAGIQAAWRLGNWNQLEEFLLHRSTTADLPDFEVSLGR